MATSNSINFTQTRDEIIADALSEIGVLRPGDTANANDVTICSNHLNKLIKHLETQGIHVWTEVEGTMFLTSGTNRYTLSGSTTNSSGDNTVKTTLSADGSSSSLTCTTVVGMAVSDNLGVVLDSGTLQWTTVSAIDTSTKIVTMATPLTGAASSGAVVYVYTSTSTKPLSISNMRFCNEAGTERLITVRGRDYFMQLPSKSTTGKVNQAFYVSGRDSGTMYVYPTPDSSSDSINFSYSRTIQDFDAASDNADIPQEWLLALTLNLAVLVAPIYGKDLNRQMPLLPAMAREALQEAQLFDVNAGSVHIVPAPRDDY